MDTLGINNFMSMTRCLTTLVLVLVAAGHPADAQDTPSKTLLQIGITHSERLPELPPNQQVGQVFDGFETQLNQNDKAQSQQQQTKPSRPQAVKNTPGRTVPVQAPAAWSDSSSVPSQRATAKPVLQKMASGSVKPPSQHRPSQAEIQAAIQAYASQRNPRGMPPVQRSQSYTLMPQSQLQAGTAINGASTNVLKGTASSEQGAYNRSSNNNAKSPTEIRFKIPAWMAGVWQRSDSNELSRVSLPSGKQMKPAGRNITRVQDRFGTYRDEHGQIWQVFDPRHATGSIDRGPDIDYHSVTAYNIITGGSDAPVVAVRATHVVVSKSTHRVVSSFQDEELNTYSKTLDGKLRTESSVKVFDAQGRPKLLTTALSMETQVAPFSGPLRKSTR